MKLILCLDDHNGMLFNGRRQSRDRAVSEDILGISGKSPLWMHADSRKLFDEDCDRICCYSVTPDVVPDEVYVFLEFDSLDHLLPMADMLVVYRWNRVYPADVNFPDEYLNYTWNLKEAYAFSGHSHSQLTREVYVR